MNLTINIQGLKGVEDALAQAGPKIAKRAVRAGLIAGATPMLEAAKALAPVLVEGTPQRQPGELRDSLVMKVKMSPKEESGTVIIGPEYKKQDGNQSPGLYGMFVEFGSVHNKIQPFLRPGFDQCTQISVDAFALKVSAAVDSLKS
jgi:HK97 gp10 family phage protein